MAGKELVKLLKQAGFALDRIKGSHYIMTNGEVTLPVPVQGKRELPTGTAQAILKQAGLR